MELAREVGQEQIWVSNSFYTLTRAWVYELVLSSIKTFLVSFNYIIVTSFLRNIKVQFSFLLIITYIKQRIKKFICRKKIWASY